MATTGLMTFNPDLGDLVEEAFERAGLEFRSAYDFETARRSLNYITLEWQNRGLNMWTIDEQSITSDTAAPNAVAVGKETYSTATGTIAIMDVALRTNAGVLASQADYMLNRISRDTYLSIPNKLTQARPLQYMVDRIDVGSTTPTLTFWPVPDLTTYQFIYNRMRRIQDSTVAATASNSLNETDQGVMFNMDTPSRFLPALVAGLAYHVAMKKPAASERVPMLKQMYEEQYQLAADEDREKAPVRFVPDPGIY